MSINQTYLKDLWFWNPKTKRIFDNDLWASVTQIDGVAKVSIPATSQAVNRTNGFAAYLRYPFYVEPTIAISPAPSQVTRSSQAYSDAEGNVQPRISAIYSASALIVTSDGNPSPAPGLDVGSVLLVEGSVNNGPRGSTAATVYPVAPAAYKPHVGALGQAVVGRSTTSNTQNMWFVGGNASFGSASLYSPKTGVDFVQVTLNDDSSLTVTDSLVGTVNNLFPSCCVIEGERFLDQLFYTGGMTSWSTLSAATKMISPTGVETAVTDCPENVTKAACLSSPYPTTTFLPTTKHYITVIGGLNDALTDSKDSVWSYDPYLDEWGTNHPLITPRRDHQTININVKRASNWDILVVGGKRGIFSNGGQLGPAPSPLGVPLNSCEIIGGFGGAPSTQDLSPQRTGPMADARYAFGMTTLPDDRVLVCGGIGYNPSYPQLDPAVPEYNYELSRCEVYDPETQLWTPIQPMLEAHSYCVCHWVKEANKVYVYGGYGSTLIEYLDLDTMLWHKSVYTMPSPVVVGSPFGMDHGFMGLIGGGAYDTNTGIFTPNDNDILM
jgi:hypothetical protein